MKTPEELKQLKEDVEALNKKLAELSEEELSQVSGGKIEILLKKELGSDPGKKKDEVQSNLIY